MIQADASLLKLENATRQISLPLRINPDVPASGARFAELARDAAVLRSRTSRLSVIGIQKNRTLLTLIAVLDGVVSAFEYLAGKQMSRTRAKANSTSALAPSP